jgi:hypothetical protein
MQRITPCMSAKSVSALVATCLLVTSCGARVRAPSGGVQGAPRVGWVIMAGTRDDPDQEFVCQSDPRSECAMPASQPNSQAFSRAYFYFFPTMNDTTYAGTIQIGFFEGTAPHEIKPNITVKRGGPVANTSVLGIVSSMPGPRELRIALNAQGGATQEIRDTVPVLVK